MLNCGDATAADIDVEVMKMLREAYEEAKRLLGENRDALDQIADFLIEKETITGKEFMRIFRKVKGIPEPEEESQEEKSRMGAKGPGNKVAEAKESVSGELEAKEQISKEPVSQEAEAKEPVSEAPEVGEPVSGAPEAREPESGAL